MVDSATAAPMVEGASEGWRTTLDKLEQEVLRMSGAIGTSQRSVVHASFHLERHYHAPVERVWKALTDEAAKKKWFGAPPSSAISKFRSYEMRVVNLAPLAVRSRGEVEIRVSEFRVRGSFSKRDPEAIDSAVPHCGGLMLETIASAHAEAPPHPDR